MKILACFFAAMMSASAFSDTDYRCKAGYSVNGSNWEFSEDFKISSESYSEIEFKGAKFLVSSGRFLNIEIEGHRAEGVYGRNSSSVLRMYIGEKRWNLGCYPI